MRTTCALLSCVLVVACGGGAPGPAPSPTPLPTTQPTQSPGTGLYLRAEYAQALPPAATFNWLPLLTIDNGTAIEGNVAVPAIFPGPLVIVPNARWISEAGMAAIVGEARRLGLLGEVTDFSGERAMPGSRLGHLTLVIDGTTHELVGDPDAPTGCGRRPCDVVPGTPAAFAAFWQEISDLELLLGQDVGAPVPYNPELVAVLFTTPARPEPGFEQQRLVTWPLNETFLEIGVEFPGDAAARCVTLAGAELQAAFPVLRAANQLTVFHDSVDTTRSAVVAVLVPGQESTCPDV